MVLRNSVRELVKGVHLSGSQVELHCSQDGVGLLVLGLSQVQVVLLAVDLHLPAQVDYLPHGQDAVAQEQPSQSASWSFEDLAEVEDAIGTGSRHHVNEHDRAKRWLSKQVVGVVIVGCGSQFSLPSLVVMSSASDVGVRVHFLGKVVHFDDVVDIVMEGLNLVQRISFCHCFQFF